MLLEAANHDGWVELALNRPEKRNALSLDLIAELEQALSDAEADPAVHAILISGRGRDFCTGFDLRAQAGERYRTSSPLALGFDRTIARVEATVSPLRRITSIHKPVIAKVHGNCLAGGTDLAFLCDIVFVAKDAVIGYPATRVSSVRRHFRCGFTI